MIFTVWRILLLFLPFCLTRSWLTLWPFYLQGLRDDDFDVCALDTEVHSNSLDGGTCAFLKNGLEELLMSSQLSWTLDWPFATSSPSYPA